MILKLEYLIMSQSQVSISKNVSHNTFTFKKKNFKYVYQFLYSLNSHKPNM
jgi:hypothetical protein